MVLVPERRADDGRCYKPHWERIFNSIIGGLFMESLIPRGSVLDAGAHTGNACCFFASVAPERTVHAIEPLDDNVRLIRERFGNLTNLKILHGGLGVRDELLDITAASPPGAGKQVDKRWFDLNSAGSKAAGPTAPTFPTGSPTPADRKKKLHVHRVDTLFHLQHGHWRGESLGFVSFDVEGSELDVVRGARATLARDQPVLAVEAFTQSRNDGELLSEIKQLGYETYLVEEGCGYNFDCRNVLCIPTSRLRSFYESHTLDLAAASGRLRAVNASSLRQYGAGWKPFKADRVHRMYGEGTPNFEALSLMHRGIKFEPTRVRP